MLTVGYMVTSAPIHAAWEGGCERLKTCGVLRVGGRAHLYRQVEKAPEKGKGFFTDGRDRTLTSVDFEDGIASYAERQIPLANFQQLLSNKNSRLYVLTDEYVLIDKLDQKRLEESPVVELISTRPEPIDLFFIQPGGFTNGYWLFHDGELVRFSHHGVEDRLFTYN